MDIVRSRLCASSNLCRRVNTAKTFYPCALLVKFKTHETKTTSCMDSQSSKHIKPSSPFFFTINRSYKPFPIYRWFLMFFFSNEAMASWCHGPGTENMAAKPNIRRRKNNGLTDRFPEHPDHINHWIGLRENIQETMVFTIKYRAFL